MAQTMHPITIQIAEGTYNAVRAKAESCGYFSLEEYISDWLENGALVDIPMTPELARALEVGLADSREGRVISLEECNRRHMEDRAAWIEARRA